jgi:hypothetical protein
VLKVSKVSRVFKEILDLLVHRERLVLQEQLEKQVR